MQGQRSLLKLKNCRIFIFLNFIHARKRFSCSSSLKIGFLKIRELISLGRNTLKSMNRIHFSVHSSFCQKILHKISNLNVETLIFHFSVLFSFKNRRIIKLTHQIFPLQTFQLRRRRTSSRTSFMWFHNIDGKTLKTTKNRLCNQKKIE